MACPDKEVDSGGVIRRRQLWSMLALLGTIGCASELPDGAQNVAIVSDLDPTGEVVLYRVRVLAGQEQLRAGRHVADPMLDYAAGVDVFEAEFTLPAGFVAEGEAVNASGGIVGRARAFGISPQGRSIARKLELADEAQAVAEADDDGVEPHEHGSEHHGPMHCDGCAKVRFC